MEEKPLERTEKIITLEQLSEDLIKLTTITTESGTDIDNLLLSQTEILKELQKSQSIFRTQLKKEVKQLSGFVIAACAAGVFFFGIKDTEKRDAFILDNAKEIIAAGLALGGGYQVFKAREDAKASQDSL